MIPTFIDAGMDSTMAATLLTVVGVINFFGTAACGAVVDLVSDTKWLPTALYAIRGVTFLAMPQVVGPEADWKTWLMVVALGLNFLSPAPPVMALCNRTWGPTLGPTLFGWMFAMHQLGAAAGALMPGRMRDASGSYEGAWQLGAILSFVGSAIAAFTPYSAEAKSAEMV